MRIRKVLGLSILILLSIFLVSCNKEEILDGYSKITFDTGSSDKIDSIIEEIGVKVTAP